jgi:hypothetical protein
MRIKELLPRALPGQFVCGLEFLNVAVTKLLVQRIDLVTRMYTVSGITNANAIEIEPTGKYASVVASFKAGDYMGSLRTFIIDQSNGTLSAGGTPVVPGINSCDIAVVSLP